MICAEEVGCQQPPCTCKENLCMNVAFCIRRRCLARFRLQFEEQLHALLDFNTLNLLAGRLLIRKLTTYFYHCICIAEHRVNISQGSPELSIWS